MTAADVKIPPEWLRAPAHETRSQLLDARRTGQREWVLARAAAASSDRRFARSETLFRDWFRRTGVFEAAGPDAGAERSGAPATRSAMLQQRQLARRVASLAFEPQEVERLADRPRAHELREWWKQREGYVEDPVARFGDSTRLELMRRRGRVVGGREEPGVDLGLALDGDGDGDDAATERVRLQRARRKQQEVTPKVTRVRHAVPDAYLRSEAATVLRAADLFAQERQSGPSGGLRRPADESAWSLPVSPIKGAKPPKRAQSLRDGTLADGLAQRSLLDQLKAAAAALPAVGAPSPPMLSPLTRHVSKRAAGGPVVRCGGFS